MQSVVDNLIEIASCIRQQGQELLLETAILGKEDLDDVFIRPKFHWEPLSDEGRRLQSRVLHKYERFADRCWALIARLPEKSRQDFDRARRQIVDTLELSKPIWSGSQADAFGAFEKNLNEQAALLRHLHGAVAGVIIVPDTNALLFNPDVARWSFEQIDKFSIALVPTVLSELDSLKVSHRKDDVRKKAEKLIRQFKEFRRRGPLSEGVTIVKKKIDLFSIAVEPDFKTTLPWLVESNADDRLVATTVEVMRSNPRSVVVTVTRDLNLQNKLEFAGFPFLEPPDPNKQPEAPGVEDRAQNAQEPPRGE